MKLYCSLELGSGFVLRRIGGRRMKDFPCGVSLESSGEIPLYRRLEF